MAAGARHRYRVWFEKSGPLPFISHHDLMRLFQRAVRRAGIPISFSQGFNPRPKISFLAPLPVYHEGLREILVIHLEEPLPTSQLRAELSSQLPQGLRIVQIETVPPGRKTRVSSFLYSVYLPLPPDFDPSAIPLQTLVVRRNRKDGTEQTLRVGDYLRDISFQPDSIRIKLDVTDGRTIRPEEFLRALGLFPVDASQHPRIVRDAVEVES